MPIKGLLYASVLPLFVAVWGCESVALIGRPDIESRESSLERRPDYRGDRDIRDRNVARDEVVGTVERIDERRNEIHIRTTEGRMTMVKYEPSTVVYARDRELRVDSLRRGDLVLVRLDRNSRGEQYADVIRMNDRGADALRR
ncbi:MAG TPA: hypothetical protein VFU31_18505 [Candidatus Binatia bacterium]|nr:hypothetical protein [Candidatus Binatia bacterium]